MTLSTIELDGILIGYSKDNYSDLSFDVMQACFLLGISIKRYREAIKETKEIFAPMGDAFFTCDPTTDKWVCYEHLRKLSLWLATRGNRIAKEFYYLATNVNLIDNFNAAVKNLNDEQVESNLEQWSIYYDGIIRIGFVLELALDSATLPEQVILPYISYDPITWRISERISEYGFKVSPVTLQQINFSFMSRCSDTSSVIVPKDAPNDIEINFDFLPLLDDCIREVVKNDEFK